uniref:Putative secreted protein n=1 Tax=Anopheles darlingi TaxID=43151 RepID=A0A2M4D8C8_ANODA
MPPFVLSTLLLCRCREDSFRDFGDSRNRSARGIVLLALLSVMELCGTRAGGLFGPGPAAPDAGPRLVAPLLPASLNEELFTVAVSRAAGALLLSRQIL